MEEARREKVTDEHNVIDDAIQARGEGFTVFSIVSAIYLFSVLCIVDQCPCSLLESFTDPLRRNSKTRSLVTTWARL